LKIGRSTLYRKLDEAARMIRQPATQTKRAEANARFAALPCRTEEPKTSPFRTFDRCMPVTDKRKSAWQKRAIVAKGGL